MVFLFHDRAAQEHDLSDIWLRIRAQHRERDPRFSNPDIPPWHSGTCAERSRHGGYQGKARSPSLHPAGIGHTECPLWSGEKPLGAFYVV
jgi:hypothetical protein